MQLQFPLLEVGIFPSFNHVILGCRKFVAKVQHKIDLLKIEYSSLPFQYIWKNIDLILLTHTLYDFYGWCNRLDCSPTRGLNSKCPAATCGSLILGNSSSSSPCERSVCAYTGYTNNNTILTNLTTESLCNSKHFFSFLFFCIQLHIFVLIPDFQANSFSNCYGFVNGKMAEHLSRSLQVVLLRGWAWRGWSGWSFLWLWCLHVHRSRETSSNCSVYCFFLFLIFGFLICYCSCTWFFMLWACV